jgi:8-oxo-dGTP pyrophosphatase MutT (NUDIX family)
MMRWMTSDAAELVPTTDPTRSALHLAGPLLAPVTRSDSDGLSGGGGPSRADGDLADRRTSPGHLTASAVVVDAFRQRSLVMLHTKLRRWLQPGGHADGDHELAGVALREAGEETGIDGLAVLVPALSVDTHSVDHGDALGRHLHLDLRFLVAAPPGAAHRGNHESTELRWATPSELWEMSQDRGLVDLVESALEVARSAPPPPSGWLS